MAQSKNKMREEMVESFLSALKENEIPWHKSWSAISERPYNASSNSVYHGVNAFYLSYIMMRKGYDDPRWCTYKQAKENGWHVKKGEQGTHVEFWSMYDRKEKRNINSKETELLREQLSPEEFKKRVKLVARNFTVFNAAQIEGIPQITLKTYVLEESELVEKRETLLKNMQVQFKEGGEESYYYPAEDCIHLPPINRFENEYVYMATLLHEAGHATGHESRMNRSIQNLFGTSDYAKEELRAEIASAFTAQILHFNQNESHMENHKAYIQNWITILEKEPQELFQAIKDAEKISDYLIEKGEFLNSPKSREVAVLGYYNSEDGTQYIHYETVNDGIEYLIDGKTWSTGDDVEHFLSELNRVSHLSDRESMMKLLLENYPHSCITNYMEQIVGEVSFENGTGLDYYKKKYGKEPASMAEGNQINEQKEQAENKSVWQGVNVKKRRRQF